MIFRSIIFLLNLFVMKTMSAVSVPTVTLSSGHKMPMVGLGTCCPPRQTVLHMVKDAIDVGYRHIDTAYIYDNEAEVGLAFEEKISLGVVKREDLFITTKLWNTYHSKRRAEDGIKLALSRLHTPYIDLMLIHWPMGYQEGIPDRPIKDGKIIPSYVDYLETWKALEEAVDAGTVKSIGLSNFNSEQIKRVYDNARIKPSVVQIESHPRLTQKAIIDLCKSYNIVVVAYSPLAEGRLMSDTTLKKIGANHQKSVAQVMIRYQVQRGVATIPKTEEKDRMTENLNVFDFSLTDSEMKEIDDMNVNLRYNTEDSAKNFPDYPFSMGYL